MRQLSHSLRHTHIRGNLQARCFTSATACPTGRTAPFRRINLDSYNNKASKSPFVSSHIIFSSRRPHNFLDQLSRTAFSTTPRANAISFRDLKSEEKPKSSSSKEAKSRIDQEAQKQEAASEETESAAERAYREAQKESEREREARRASSKEDSTRREKEENAGKSEREQKGKEEAPPPPRMETSRHGRFLQKHSNQNSRLPKSGTSLRKHFRTQHINSQRMSR